MRDDIFPEQPSGHSGPPVRAQWGPQDMATVIEGMEEELMWEGAGGHPLDSQPGQDEARAIDLEGAHSVERGEREAREVGPGLSHRPVKRRRRRHSRRSP